jgi:hypothetical protein
LGAERQAEREAGAQDFAGLLATAPGNLGRIDALDLYGVSTRRFRPGRTLRD